MAQHTVEGRQSPAAAFGNTPTLVTAIRQVDDNDMVFDESLRVLADGIEARYRSNLDPAIAGGGPRPGRDATAASSRC